MQASLVGKACGLLFVTVLSLLPLSAHAEGKTVQICNRMGKTLYLSIGWMDYGFPVASGWYVFNINDCKRLTFPKADSLLPLFAYAYDSEDREYRPTAGAMTNNFCINRANAFQEKSTTACTLMDTTAKQIASDWESFGSLGFPFADVYRWELR